MLKGMPCSRDVDRAIGLLREGNWWSALKGTKKMEGV